MAQRYTSQRSSSRRRADDSYNMYISQGYYQYGSQARQLQPEPEIYDDYEERKVVRKKKARHKVAKPKTTVEFSFGTKKKTSLLTYAAVSVISSGAILCLIFMAVTAQKKIDINTLKADLKQAKQNNYSLQASVYDGYDLAEVEYLATTKLKMMKPEEHQIVRVSIPEQSYIVQYDNEPEHVENKFTFGNVYDIIFSNP